MTLLRDFLSKLADEWQVAEMQPGDEGLRFQRLKAVTVELQDALPPSLNYPLIESECCELKTRLEEIGTMCIRADPHGHVGNSRSLSRHNLRKIVVRFEELEDALWI